MSYSFESLSATRLEVVSAAGKTISTATGAWYRRAPNAPLHLLTNWHVVTDRAPQNPKITTTGAVPTSLIAYVHQHVGPDQINSSQVGTLTIPLNSPDGEVPSWLEHASLRHRFDVVAIPVNMATEAEMRVQIREFGDGSLLDRNPFFEPAISDDAFVIGFPWGFSGGGPALPLFKRGSIASEPFFGQNGLPRFLIDCRTARGMSGSPVLAMRNVWGEKVGPGRDARFGRVGRFAGIYSGRLSIDDISGSSRDSMSAREEQLNSISEIGIVWSKAAIDQLLDNPAPGWKVSNL